MKSTLIGSFFSLLASLAFFDYFFTDPIGSVLVVLLVGSFTGSIAFIALTRRLFTKQLIVVFFGAPILGLIIFDALFFISGYFQEAVVLLALIIVLALAWFLMWGSRFLGLGLIVEGTKYAGEIAEIEKVSTGTAKRKVARDVIGGVKDTGRLILLFSAGAVIIAIIVLALVLLRG